MVKNGKKTKRAIRYETRRGTCWGQPVLEVFGVDDVRFFLTSFDKSIARAIVQCFEEIKEFAGEE